MKRRKLTKTETQRIRNMYRGGASLEQISEQVDRSKGHINDYIFLWKNKAIQRKDNNNK